MSDDDGPVKVWECCGCGGEAGGDEDIEWCEKCGRNFCDDCIDWCSEEHDDCDGAFYCKKCQESFKP